MKIRLGPSLHSSNHLPIIRSGLRWPNPWRIFFFSLIGLSLSGLVAVAGPDAPLSADAASDAKVMTPLTAPKPMDDWLHGAINLDYSNYHLTSRGINLQDKGLVCQQSLRLEWQLYRPEPKNGQIIDEVKLITSVWSDIDTHVSGADISSWNEIDPTIGANVRFLKDWSLESLFTAYVSETSSFDTCWAWDPRLTYHDHFLGNFSINPYTEFFLELDNKITVVLSPATSQKSYYGVLGMDPTYAFSNLPLKLELPTYFTVPGDNFYQRVDGSGGGSGVGLFATMLKATVPISGIPESYGQWSVYAGVQYDYLNNPGLLDGNLIAGAAQSRERNLVVYHAGLTVRF